MKKILSILAVAAFFAACGGTETPKTEDITPEVKELQQKTDDLKSQSEKLNEKADSILNNI